MGDVRLSPSKNISWLIATPVAAQIKKRVVSSRLGHSGFSNHKSPKSNTAPDTRIKIIPDGPIQNGTTSFAKE